MKVHPGTALRYNKLSDWSRDIDQSDKLKENVSNKSQKSLRVIQDGRPRRGCDFSSIIKAFAGKMAEGIADIMPLALRCVGDAIKLDSENRTKV